MAALEQATRVQAIDPPTEHDQPSSARAAGRYEVGWYQAELSPAWEVWGPQGGYLAAVALCAAGVQCARALPGSINVHFVGAGQSGPVTVEVTVERRTSVGTSLSIRIHQASDRGHRVILTGSVWGIDDDLPGLVHQEDGQPLESMSPEGLLNMQQRLAGRDMPPPHPFWQHLETRPLIWDDDWETRPARPPKDLHWYRFVDGECFEDPWLDACRSLIVLDVDSWGAATRPHTGTLEHFAPTIELAVRFMGATNLDPWLLSEASAPVAANGLMAHTGRVWTPDKRIVATGGSTLLCRPAARRPDGR